MAHLLKIGTSLLSIAGKVYGLKDNFVTTTKPFLPNSTAAGGSFDPRGNGRLWVSNYGASKFVIYDANLNVLHELTGYGSAGQIAFDPADPTKVFCNYSGGIIVVDADSYSVLSTISGYGGSVAFDPANNRILVSNGSGGNLVVLDRTTFALINTVTGFASPKGIAFDAANNRVFLSNFGTDQVLVLNATTFATTHTINGFSGLQLMAIDPAEERNQVLIASGNDSYIVFVDRTSLAITKKSKFLDALAIQPFFHPVDYRNSFYITYYGAELLKVTTTLV